MNEDVPPPVDPSDQTNYALRDTEITHHTDLGDGETDTEFGHTAYEREQDRIESQPCRNCGRPSPPERRFFCCGECYFTHLCLKNDEKYAPTPKRYECDWCGRIFRGAASDERRFCSMDCKHEWHSENFSGEDHPLWKGGAEDYYGTDWHEQRERAIERDNGRCQSCRMTMEKHIEKFGQELHVHHITPFRTFEDSTEANELANLITLCQTCHREHEGDSKEEILTNET